MFHSYFPKILIHNFIKFYIHPFTTRLHVASKLIRPWMSSHVVSTIHNYLWRYPGRKSNPETCKWGLMPFLALCRSGVLCSQIQRSPRPFKEVAEGLRGFPVFPSPLHCVSSVFGCCGRANHSMQHPTCIPLESIHWNTIYIIIFKLVPSEPQLLWQIQLCPTMCPKCNDLDRTSGRILGAGAELVRELSLPLSSRWFWLDLVSRCIVQYYHKVEITWTDMDKQDIQDNASLYLYWCWL
jgi:hypothetical protein